MNFILLNVLGENHKHILLYSKSCYLDISKLLVQDVLFLTLKILWISLIQDLMLVLFFVIPHLTRLIEYIIIKHFFLRNPCTSPLRKLKMSTILRV